MRRLNSLAFDKRSDRLDRHCRADRCKRPDRHKDDIALLFCGDVDPLDRYDVIGAVEEPRAVTRKWNHNAPGKSHIIDVLETGYIQNHRAR